MRAEKNNPGQRYNDFWQWLLTDWHPAWIIALVFGYTYYLVTTVEA